MGEWPLDRVEREITPKDVFARSNMPSRWERLTNVAPKTALDRRYLAFMAARYRGDKRLPRPHEIDPPDELQIRRTAQLIGLASGATGAVLIASGGATHVPALVIVGLVLLVLALVAVMVVFASTQPAVSEFDALRSRCERAESRLHADPLHSADTSTLNKMITCDEGTLAFCAAKIASEIERDPNWTSSRLDIMPIDLWNELAEVGESARQIAEDREATVGLERSRLRDEPDVRATIDEDNQLRKEAIALLATRVHTLADYRGPPIEHDRATRQHRARPRSSARLRPAGNEQTDVMPNELVPRLDMTVAIGAVCPSLTARSGTC